MKKVFKIAIIAVMILTMGLCITTATTTPRVETAYAAVYQQGSSGSVVKTMQRKLKNWGYYTGAVDGIFGAKTREAVKYFQRKNGLTVDGIVGPATLKALGMSSGSSSSSSSSYSDSDLNLLARLIYGEARGESYVGQVAVGAVVMNRIKSSSFPNTMAGVIYQSYAFTAVDDGQINLTPNATARKAAQDAMNGWDPTYGALYYYNPRTATSAWIFSRKTTITIGNHVFAI
ncbi:MAG: spore cortex-lytic enzyme [Clostridia bacterium]|nr:spore cortex-lytic enzyme [Clostridia bacterium]MBR2448655.1 spore cortex-lytic enzyme [Clostridia bacterium]